MLVLDVGTQVVCMMTLAVYIGSEANCSKGCC